ncbi:acireductone synthase [Kaarinaea lacus]
MIKAVVTDIEGTTSSLSFVKDVLFPYAREHIGEYVHDHAEDDEILEILNDVRKETGENLDTESIIAQLEQWIDQDRKVTALKTLQGLLWEEGYRQGDFQGHIYPDACEQLKTWHEKGIKLYIYSSGSVYAQKLLFGHTEFGDLNKLFSGYFDTHVGAKSDTASYREIAKELGITPGEILFLSDIQAELDAASTAGMQTLWLVRDGDLSLAAPHMQVRSFSEIDLPG